MAAISGVRLFPEMRKGFPDSRDDQAGHIHRQMIGYIGLLLPLVLYVIGGLRPIDRSPWRPLDSISAYYYSGAAAAFTGMLVVLALVLFAYEGYGNGHRWADRTLAIVASVAALGVAFFPTRNPEAVPPLLWWTKWIGIVHYVSAGVLFVSFGIFSLWLFRMGESASSWRNRVCLWCGIAILAAVAGVGVQARRHEPIFMPEAIALVAFAASWLAKGKIDRSVATAALSLRAAARRTLAVRAERLARKPS